MNEAGDPIVSSDPTLEHFLTFEKASKRAVKKATKREQIQDKCKLMPKSEKGSTNTLHTENSTEYETNQKEDGSNELSIDLHDEIDDTNQSRIDEFYDHLSVLIEDNPIKYSNLLTTLPSFVRDHEEDPIHDSTDKNDRNGDAFLLKFLRAGNNDCDDATKILINYVLLMRDHPKYYISSLQPDTIQKVYNEKIHTVLLHRDKHGRRVFIWRPGKWNPLTVSFTDCYCAMYMLCEMIALEPKTQIAGCTVVCDGSNIGLKQLTAMGIEDIRNCANFIQVTIMSNLYCND